MINNNNNNIAGEYIDKNYDTYIIKQGGTHIYVYCH